MSEQSTLALSIMNACKSDAWVKVIRPYIETERDRLTREMAFQTDALQLMRLAGGMQALNGIMELEAQARTTFQKNVDNKIVKFS